MSRPSNGKTGGKGYVRSCLICRQYREKPQNTNWWCNECCVPLCKKHRGRESSCYEEHIQRCDDPVVGCFERKSEIIVVPQAYKLYKPQNMTDIPTLPAFDANEEMVPQIMETNTADSAVGDGVQEGSGSGSSSSSSSDSDSGEEVIMMMKTKEPPATTKKRSRPVRVARKSKRIAKRIAGGRR